MRLYCVTLVRHMTHAGRTRRRRTGRPITRMGMKYARALRDVTRTAYFHICICPIGCRVRCTRARGRTRATSPSRPRGRQSRDRYRPRGRARRSRDRYRAGRPASRRPGPRTCHETDFGSHMSNGQHIRESHMRMHSVTWHTVACGTAVQWREMHMRKRRAFRRRGRRGGARGICTCRTGAHTGDAYAE